MTLAPRVVVVHRRTELEELLDQHGTRPGRVLPSGSRGGRSTRCSTATTWVEALATVSTAIPVDRRRGERSGPTRGSCSSQATSWSSGAGRPGRERRALPARPAGDRRRPGARRNPGVLVRHRAEVVASLLPAAVDQRAPVEPADRWCARRASTTARCSRR